MDPKGALIEDLRTLNRISEILNQSADVQSAINSTLKHLIDLMGLKTGWITLLDPGVAREKNPRFLLAYQDPKALMDYFVQEVSSLLQVGA